MTGTVLNWPVRCCVHHCGWRWSQSRTWV